MLIIVLQQNPSSSLLAQACVIHPSAGRQGRPYKPPTGYVHRSSEFRNAALHISTLQQKNFPRQTKNGRCKVAPWREVNQQGQIPRPPVSGGAFLYLLSPRQRMCRTSGTAPVARQRRKPPPTIHSHRQPQTAAMLPASLYQNGHQTAWPQTLTSISRADSRRSVTLKQQNLEDCRSVPGHLSTLQGTTPRRPRSQHHHDTHHERQENAAKNHPIRFPHPPHLHTPVIRVHGGVMEGGSAAKATDGGLLKHARHSTPSHPAIHPSSGSPTRPATMNITAPSASLSRAGIKVRS